MAKGFDRFIDRHHTNSIKWDYTNEDELPMFIADMDFESAPAVKARIEKRLQHPVYGYTRTPDELINSFISWFKEEYDFDLKKEWVVPISGIVPALAVVSNLRGGSSITVKPWLWVEEDGSIAGYDAEVIYAIDKLLPQYEFEFEKTEFASLFTGVDSGRYTVAVNNFNWRADRAEKYLFGEEYVCYEKEAIYVRKGFDEIKTLEDVGGHKAFTTGNGLMTQLFLEEYNEQHPDNSVDLVYTDADTLKQFQDVNAGVADFGFLSQPSLKNYLEIYPTFYDDFDIIELTDEESEKVCSPFTYFIYAKTPEGEEVKAAVDEAIRTLKEDGTIKALSEEYSGYDVTGR